jgi:hypothetical protein
MDGGFIEISYVIYCSPGRISFVISIKTIQNLQFKVV